MNIGNSLGRIGTTRSVPAATASPRVSLSRKPIQGRPVARTGGAWDDALDSFADELARAEALLDARPGPDGQESTIIGEVLALPGWAREVPNEPLPEHLRSWASAILERQRAVIEAITVAANATKRESDAIEALAPGTGRVRPVFVDAHC